MKKKSGFTLIELSIVIVIIGLVIGGISVGKSLIKLSSLRVVITEINQFKTAIATFQLKYSNQLPGDTTLATKFFGTTDAFGNTINNGNGDGVICINGGAINSCGEQAYIWHHLRIAGLITGQYNGFFNFTLQPVGVSTPGSKYSPIASYYFGSSAIIGQVGPSAFTYGGGDLLVLFSMGSPPTYNTYNTGSNAGSAVANIVKVDDALSIDLKIDDGKPVSGKVGGDDYSNSTNCRTSGSNGLYLNNSIGYCYMIFVLY